MDVMTNNSNSEVENRLRTEGFELPQLPPKPIGTFRNARRVGNLIYISGQGPVQLDGTLMTGKVGQDVSGEEAAHHAALVCVNILAVLKQEIEDFSNVVQFVKLLGMVNSVLEFRDHPAVINGCSDLLGKVLGEAGGHARSAFGVGSLPNNITVEIEAIVEVK